MEVSQAPTIVEPAARRLLADLDDDASDHSDDSYIFLNEGERRGIWQAWGTIGKPNAINIGNDPIH